MRLKKLVAGMLAAGMMWAAVPGLAEQTEAAEAAAEETAEAVETAAEETAEAAAGTTAAALPQSALPDNQKLDASYTLALNAINAEDYATAKEYLDICFVYCDPVNNPAIYADLLLKRACINVIEEKNDMALLNLDAALRVQPDLADAYLVRTQVYTSIGEMDRAVDSLEKYIELTQNTALYETVAQLQESMGNIEAAQEAYAKYAEGAGAEVEEAGFQSGLYMMEAGKFEDAIAAFEAYADNETYAAGAMYNIGVCRMNLGDYTGAGEAFTACEEKGGSFTGLYYNRGVCSLLSAEWKNAAEDFAKSITTEPFAADAEYNLGLCQMQLGEYEAAVAAFTELIGDGEGAEPAADQAAVNIGAYYYRAACRSEIGDAEGAIADYTVCIDQGYELAQSYYQRAQVYAATGDAEKQNSDLANSLKYAE